MAVVRETIGPRLIVALDNIELGRVPTLLGQLDPGLCRIKIGKELFTRGGPALVEQVMTRGYTVFLDLKFHDIPSTVALACEAAATLGVWMVNVHALGGKRMLEAARAAVDKFPTRPLLIAVTVLTSLAEIDLHEIGLLGTVQDNVLHLASLAKQAGLDGIVCSAQEVSLLRACHGLGFKLVTPGIRPPGFIQQDQRRTLSPSEAMEAGADYLVIGRPITKSQNPSLALRAMYAEIESFN
jgi:orotidine-5'-phosphate decarboxylase